MNRWRVLAAGLLLALASLGLAAGDGSGRPPHVERPVAGASAPLPLAATGGEQPGAVVAQVEWVEGVARGEWFAGVELAEREAAAAREAAARAVPRSTGGGGGSGSCDLTGWTLPDEILIRESRCSEDAFNAGGCGGRGCVGAAQLDLGHFANPSPWGGVGACWGLDPYSIADQQECVRRLSGDGSNLAPWRG